MNGDELSEQSELTIKIGDRFWYNSSFAVSSKLQSSQLLILLF